MPEMPDLNAILEMAQNAQAELQKAQDNLDKIEVDVARAERVARTVGADDPHGSEVTKVAWDCLLRVVRA